MPDDRPISDALMQQWIAAQDRLVSAPDPQWGDCAELIRLTSLLGECFGGEVPGGSAVLHAFPLCLAPGEPHESGQNWEQFLAADQMLRLYLAEAWARAAKTASSLGHDPVTDIRCWSRELDAAIAAVAERPGYLDVLVVWLRSALAMRLPIMPPDLPASPAPPAPPYAMSAKETVWQDRRVTLSRYCGSRAGTPLLIVHGLIGRQTVSDLEPGRSLVADLLADGADLWVLDWGNPGADSRNDTFADQAEGWLGRAVTTMRDQTGKRPALLGICQGGLFVLIQAARHPAALAGIALTGTPVDFHADLDGRQGAFNRLARAMPSDVVEGLIAPTGLLPGAFLGTLFQVMTPGRTFAKYTADLAAKLEDPAEMATFARMEAWLADRPDHPGAAAREWLIELYQRNALIKRRFEIAGTPVDLSAISCPILNIVALNDHIVPPACSRALAQHVPVAPYELLEVPAGHIGVFVSRRARGTVAARLSGWLDAL
ncbi:MAG: alpha/beta fold hydrolase [Pseudomonadota bacterium]